MLFSVLFMSVCVSIYKLETLLHHEFGITVLLSKQTILSSWIGANWYLAKKCWIDCTDTFYYPCSLFSWLFCKRWQITFLINISFLWFICVWIEVWWEKLTCYILLFSYLAVVWNGHTNHAFQSIMWKLVWNSKESIVISWQTELIVLAHHTC